MNRVHRLAALVRRWHFPLLFLLSALPACLFLLYMCIPDAPAVCPALCAAVLPLGMLSTAVPAKRRMAAAVISSALLMLLCALALPLRAQPMLAAFAALLVLMLFLSLPYAARDVQNTSPALYLFGFAAHLFINVMLYSPANDGALRSLLTVPMTIAFFLYLPLFLLALNRISLDNASQARYRLPASMRRVNRLLTLAFLALVLLLFLSPAVVRGIIAFFHALRLGIIRLGIFLLSLLPEGGGAGGMGMPAQPGMFPAMEEAPEPSALAVFLEHVASALSLLIVLVGSVILLRALVRQLIRLSRVVFSRLRRYVSTVSEDYEDEITDTREDGSEKEFRLAGRLLRRNTRKKPQTPGETIRYHYARLLRRHPAWPQSSTARENLAPDAASLYEKARYSAHPATQEEAERFEEHVRRA